MKCLWINLLLVLTPSSLFWDNPPIKDGEVTMAKSFSGIPQDIYSQLVAADKRNGFPVGTMAAVMQQEIGGQFDRFLGDPTAYHYAADANGRRIAPHTGKESTAFGPFGLLDSTVRDPGWGVAPLKDKSIGEQIRFAADYLGARAKSAGGLQQGLAGYGQGPAYARQVMGRIGQQTPPVVLAQEAAPASTPIPAPQVPALDQVAQAPVNAPAPVVLAQGPDPWQEFQKRFDAPAAAPKARTADAAWNLPEMQIPDFMGAVKVATAPSKWTGFKGLA